jgi:glycerol uptake facilitator-like aquaporin
MFGRNKVAVLVAEFLGTGVLVLTFLAVHKPQVGIPFFTALGVALAVVVMTLAVGTSSGAHFNPALTLAQWAARRINTLNALLYIAMQLVGAWAALALYLYLTNSEVQGVGDDKFNGRVLLAEAVGTAVFAFAWAAASYRRLKSGAFAATAGLAFAVGIWIASLAGFQMMRIDPSAGFGYINPALALGADAWVWGTHVLGPILGALIGFNLYALLFAPAEALRESSGRTVVVPAEVEASKVVSTVARQTKVVASSKPDKASGAKVKSSVAVKARKTSKNRSKK